MPPLSTLTGDIASQVQNYGSLRSVPAAATGNVRNDMYLASDAIRIMGKTPAGFSSDETTKLQSTMGALNAGTRFIPTWVKIAVAVALGLGHDWWAGSASSSRLARRSARPT